MSLTFFKKIVLALFAIILVVPSQGFAAGITLAWRQSYAGAPTYNGGYYNNAMRIDRDPSGNIYVAGSSIVSGGVNWDGRLMKYNSAGTLLWNVTYDNAVGPYGSQDTYWDVAVDSTGASVYVGGYYNVLSAVGGVTYSMATVTKYTSAGAFVWRRDYSPVGTVTGASNVGRSIDIDAAGNVYLGANTGTTAARDCRILKYDPSGNLTLNVVYNKGTQEYGADVAVDGTGNLYLGCVYNTGASTYSQDVVKYNSAGTLLWDYARVDGNAYPGVFVDASGNVYGSAYSNNTPDATTYHTRVFKLNSAGAVLWNVTYVALTGKLDGAIEVQVDSAGDVYVAGQATNASNIRDIMLLKFSSAGALLEDLIYDTGGHDYARGLFVDPSKNIFVSGRGTDASNNDTIELIKFSQGCSGPFAASWTDPTLTANSTKIRKVHIDELRAAINTRRVDAGLSAYSWTDPTLTANSTKIRKVHIDELRAAIGQVYSTCGQAAPTWTDPTLTANSTKIRKVHIDELRSVTAGAL